LARLDELEILILEVAAAAMFSIIAVVETRRSVWPPRSMAAIRLATSWRRPRSNLIRRDRWYPHFGLWNLRDFADVSGQADSPL